MQYRKIIHVDMDAFYASIEQRDHPEYRGKPVAVGKPERRGVVAAASYEARQFGVHSAMPSLKAQKLCPKLIFTPGRMAVYKEVSSRIREIFFRYTDLVEPLSLDEAFLDVTKNKVGLEFAVDIARQIKQEIRQELNLTASAGISYNKFLAKIASDYRKPNGLFVIHPEKAIDFIARLPIESFWGVGQATAKRLRSLRITNGEQLREHSLEFLIRHFGKSGSVFYNFARGIDNRPVEPNRIRKSVGCEETYPGDIDKPVAIRQAIPLLAADLLRRLERARFLGNTLTLKAKYPDFTQHTRSVTVSQNIHTHQDIVRLATELLEKLDCQDRKFRLLGLSLSNPHEETCHSVWVQLLLNLSHD